MYLDSVFTHSRNALILFHNSSLGALKCTEPVHRRQSVAVVRAAIADLEATFGNKVATSQALCAQHANTTTWIAPEPPDAVLFPQSTDDVRLLEICNRHQVPIIPFGAGTSFEGSVNAPWGGVSIDFRDMNRLLSVHAEDFDCVVEPGITRKQLNEQLPQGQRAILPVDPGADASLGGMASTQHSGTTAVRYGTMKDNVLALKVVLPNGELMTTSRRARKSSAGYDLTRLIVGAEGTLGLITEMTLKLHAIPEAVASGVCHFPTIQACCDAAIAAIQSGIPMARVELLDEMQARVCNVSRRAPCLRSPLFSGVPWHRQQRCRTVSALRRDRARFWWFVI